LPKECEVKQKFIVIEELAGEGAIMKKKKTHIGNKPSGHRNPPLLKECKGGKGAPPSLEKKGSNRPLKKEKTPFCAKTGDILPRMSKGESC